MTSPVGRGSRSASSSLRPLDDDWAATLLTAAAMAVAVASVALHSNALAALGLSLACLALYVHVMLARLCSYDPGLAQPLPKEVRTPIDVERFIAHRDMADGPVQMAAGSSIRWNGDYGSQTELCVLYMHGWSASPRESEPVDVRVAQELRANSLRFRLSGHGLCPLERAGQAMHRDATKHNMLRDMAEAFACAKVLGKRVVVLSASTGSTLALWLCAQPWARAQRDIVAVVAISPALSLRAPTYPIIKWLVALLPATASELVLTLAVGSTRRLRVLSEDYKRTWTTVYPSAAGRHAIELYMSVELSVSARHVNVPLLVFANPKDPIVDLGVTRRFTANLDAEVEIELITDSEMPHNITGIHTSPSTVERVIERTLRFVRPRLPNKGPAPSRDPERHHVSPKRESRPNGQTPKRSPKGSRNGSSSTRNWPR